MRLGPPPALDDARVPASIEAAVGSPTAVRAWLGSLRTLARSTAAAAALEDERRELAPEEAAFRARLSSGAFVAALEAYAGLPLQGDHRLYLSPFHAAGGVANVIQDRPDGRVRVESLFGPLRKGATADFWTVRVPGTLWHEEAHGVLDPLSTVWAARIERAKPADASAICYGHRADQWNQCVREHVVRAVMLRLMARRLGGAAAAEQLAFEHPERFHWLRPMIAALQDYEKDRRRWPTLADFYPRLLDAIRPDAAEDRLPFDPSREPASARARVALLARAALPRMRPGPARRTLRRALALAAAKVPAGLPAPPAADPRAASLTARGVDAFAAGRKDEALALFDRALADDPGDAEAALSRATVLESLGRTRDAGRAYDAAVRAARRSRGAFPAHVLADALSSRGRLRLAAGRKAQARRDLAAALAAAPQDWPGRAEARALLERAR
jgi:tetratricopeptide (TPR) repeat protein